MARTASKAPRTTGKGLAIERRFTTEGTHPYDELEWESRDAVIGDPAAPAFEQRDVEFPKTWTQNATNIVAQKYFRGQPGSPEREASVKTMIDRVAGTISDWGREGGYFATDADADAFEAELTSILVNQKAAFNSPVWFNVGWRKKPQCSACFILSVEDDMDSILGWNTKEGVIFKGGSGSGINLSKIRGSNESLSKGGTASGPVSFMRGADSWAGAIKSGGGTRRAAKMVVLDVDHPDIKKFIWCKADEEKKAAALRDAGFDMRLDSEAFASVQFQNANNSVRVSDEFMQAAADDNDWELINRVDGSVAEKLKARELLAEIADAAWQCADPGVQYDSIINRWHTCPESGRINASNPCSEYMHVDDSACNLASLNLMRFRNEDGTFNVDDFTHAVDIVFLAQEIIVSPSSYPTEQIGENARKFRQLGMGYANLGALLMSNGLPYDSDEGRAVAAAITALMTGRGYRRSAEVAGELGPYEAYEPNREPHNQVMRMHQSAAYEIDDDLVEEPLLHAARESWDEAVALGEAHGYRNAQATVLAPTGTISFLMDCDTTGIEPDFSLVKFKELVGGGSMKIVNGSVDLALETLGYSESEVSQIEAYIAEHDTIIGAPGPEGRAPARVRRRGRRALDLAHRPHRHDVRDAAVHLGSDLEDGEPAVDGDDRRHRRRLLIRLGEGPEGPRDLPRRLEDRPGAEDRRRREEGRRGRGRRRAARAEEDAARARVDHAQVLDRDAGGLHHRRQVRGRLGRRDLPHRHRQGGLDDQGPDERLRHGDLDRPPVRGAARGLRRQVLLHALRARGHHAQPRDPVREVAARLHHALARQPLRRRRRLPREPRDHDRRGQGPEGRAARAADRGHGRPAPTTEGNGNGNGNGHADPKASEVQSKESAVAEAKGNAAAKADANKAEAAEAAKAQPATAALTDTPPVRPAKMRGLELGPACDQCGGMMQRTGSCYTCSSCGNNTGCG